MAYELISYKSSVATVKWIPNKFLQFFGFKETISEYKYDGETYTFGGGRVWYNKKTGEKIGGFEKLDEMIRKQNWNS